MKNLLKLKQVIAFSIGVLIFTACSSQRNAAVSNKVSKGAISGTWTVSDVRLEGFPSGYAVKNAFDLMFLALPVIELPSMPTSFRLKFHTLFIRWKIEGG